MSNNSDIPDGDVLKDYRKIFFAMKKILDPSYNYLYEHNQNQERNFTRHQSLEINGNTLIDKLMMNNTEIVDGTQGSTPMDDTLERYYLYIVLSQKAIYPKFNNTDINPTISNFFMAHELSHIVYRKIAEKLRGYINAQNLRFLFRDDFEINMRPKTQNKEMLCDIFGIIILWVASILDENTQNNNRIKTIRYLKSLFENLNIASINGSHHTDEIKFLFQELQGSDTHPSCQKRLLTIKFLIDELYKLPKTNTPKNIYNLCCQGINALHMFNVLNSGNIQYNTNRVARDYIEYEPVPINNDWNSFRFTPRRTGGGINKKSIKRRHRTNKRKTSRKNSK